MLENFLPEGEQVAAIPQQQAAPREDRAACGSGCCVSSATSGEVRMGEARVRVSLTDGVLEFEGPEHFVAAKTSELVVDESRQRFALTPGRCFRAKTSRTT